MVLEILTGEGYPATPLSYKTKNLNLPRDVIDPLRVALRQIKSEDGEANCLHKWHDRHSSATGCFDFEMVALHLATRTASHLVAYRKDVKDRGAQHSNSSTLWRKRIAADRHRQWTLFIKRKESLSYLYDIDLPNDSGSLRKQADLLDQSKVIPETAVSEAETSHDLDLLHIDNLDLVRSALDKTPAQVCEHIPEAFRVLRLESVIRSELLQAFLQLQEDVRRDLIEVDIEELRNVVPPDLRREAGKRNNERQTLIDELVRPRLTFHGTRKDLVPLIVREGFRVPTPEGVRCGSTFGQTHAFISFPHSSLLFLIPSFFQCRSRYLHLTFTSFLPLLHRLRRHPNPTSRLARYRTNRMRHHNGHYQTNMSKR